MSYWPFEPLRPFCAEVLAVDPPWEFGLWSGRGEGKSAQAHYECLPLVDIKSLPVSQLARGDCWLFLWVTAPMLDVGFDVMRCWGFRYVSRTSWRKTTINGKSRLGTGYVVRTMHEDVLIGAVGEPTRARALPSLFDGVAREHSRKPEEFYSLVERFAPQAWRVELFSRQSRSGWMTWGHEATKFDEVAA